MICPHCHGELREGHRCPPTRRWFMFGMLAAPVAARIVTQRVLVVFCSKLGIYSLGVSESTLLPLRPDHLSRSSLKALSNLEVTQLWTKWE